MITKEDIIKEARKRHPTSKPRNYLNEGERLGFIEGALWMKSEFAKKNIKGFDLFNFTTMKYKNYILKTTNGSTFIYKDSELMGCTHSDFKSGNSVEKAKVRIDKGKVNMISK